MQVAYACGMAEENPEKEEPGQKARAEVSHRRARRHAKLQQLLKDHGGAAAVATETGIERTHLIALDRGRRGLGDTLAERLEDFYKLGRGWFDAPEASTDWPFKRVSLERVRSLEPDDLLRVEGRLAEALEWVEKAPASQHDASNDEDQAERDARIAARTLGFPGLSDAVVKKSKGSK